MSWLQRVPGGRKGQISERKKNCFNIDSHGPALTGTLTVPGLQSAQVALLNELQPKERAMFYGFSWLTRLAADPAKRNALIAFDQIQVADNASRLLTMLLPGKAFERFKKGETVIVGAASLTIMTKRKCPATWEGPVLVIYPSQELLNVVDGIEGATDMMVVPWQPLDQDAPVAAWIAKWSAKPITPLTQTTTGEENS